MQQRPRLSTLADCRSPHGPCMVKVSSVAGPVALQEVAAVCHRATGCPGHGTAPFPASPEPALLLLL